jgi:hypothetical protein
MRKITREAQRAFKRGRPFKKGNTEVKVQENITALSLHGNTIALENENGVFIQNAGYFTATTKERLNGLYGIHIQQKNFEWYLNGEHWDGRIIKIRD